VVVRVRAPADRLFERAAVGLALAGVLNVARDAVELEVARGPRLVGDRVVDDATRVAQQVERLARAPHHAEVEPAVMDQRLNRTDAREAVGAQRSE
jgi:hypothetical protein